MKGWKKGTYRSCSLGTHEIGRNLVAWFRKNQRSSMATRLFPLCRLGLGGDAPADPGVQGRPLL